LLLVQGGLIGLLLVQGAQRRRAQQGLAERLQFETVLSDLSTVLLSCPAAEVDREVEAGLRRVVEDLGVDRATIWALEDGSTEARLTHSWTREGVPPLPPAVLESEAPRIFSRLREGHVVRIPQPADPPAAVRIDRESLARYGTRSTAVIPLIERGSVLGGLSVGTVLEERQWSDEMIPRLRLLADVFTNALARQRAERVAHESAEQIRDLAGRLMTAQEAERGRIARELHDRVSQELAALSIALSALEAGLPEGTAPDRRRQVARLQGRAAEMAEAIRHLSHELHPGILQYAGLAAALRSHCQEFERERGLAVKLQADDDLGDVPADVALCLYRVTQEALQNVARHAKASQVRVVLVRDGTDLVLTIGDDGQGFDLAERRRHGGLGLISLDERVRLAKGRLTIDTQPQRGTEIQVVVPLSEIRDAPRDRTAR
jgi:signal transduction histidine kinase